MTTGGLNIPQGIFEKLACPDCKSRVAAQSDGLHCDRCGRTFPIAAQGSLPILFPRNSECPQTGFEKWQRCEPKGTRKKGYRETRRLPRTNVTRIGSPHRRRFSEIIGNGSLLNIGSGQRHIRNRDGCVNLDIQPHNNVDVVGDAHGLPFLDCSFDAVMSASVFEHLKDPFCVAEEVARVLKPGGWMWCDVPFAYPIHGSPHDFFRYTPQGLASVFRALEPDTVAPSLGPVTAIALFAERVGDAVFPGKVGFVARWCLAWLLQPFKYLDPWLVRRDPNCASGFFILARKPMTNSPGEHA